MECPLQILFCYTMDKAGTGKSGSEYANVILIYPEIIRFEV